MKIKYTEKWRNGVKERILSSYVADNLDGDNFDSGELETLKRTVENLKDFNGRLIELLFSKGIVDIDGLKYLLDTLDDIQEITND